MGTLFYVRQGFTEVASNPTQGQFIFYLVELKATGPEATPGKHRHPWRNTDSQANGW